MERGEIEGGRRIEVAVGRWKVEGGTELGNEGLEEVLMVDIGRSQGNVKGTSGRIWNSCGSIFYFVSLLRVNFR